MRAARDRESTRLDPLTLALPAVSWSVSRPWCGSRSGVCRERPQGRPRGPGPSPGLPGRPGRYGRSPMGGTPVTAQGRLLDEIQGRLLAEAEQPVLLRSGTSTPRRLVRNTRSRSTSTEPQPHWVHGSTYRTTPGCCTQVRRLVAPCLDSYPANLIWPTARLPAIPNNNPLSVLYVRNPWNTPGFLAVQAGDHLAPPS